MNLNSTKNRLYIYLTMSRAFLPFALVIGISVGFLTSCQTKLKPLVNGTTAFDLERYGEAIPLLAAEISSSKNRDEKILKSRQLAFCYEELGFHQKAKQLHKSIYQTTDDQADLYAFIDALIRTNAIDSAKRYLEICRRIDPQNIGNINRQIDLLNRYQIEQDQMDSLGSIGHSKIYHCKELSSSGYDYGIAIHHNQLFVSSDRLDASSSHPYTQGGNSNIYSTSLPSLEPKLYAESWTSSASEDCPSFHPNDSIAIFTRCAVPTEGNVSSFCKLYISKKDYLSWSLPEEIELFENQDSFNLGQAQWDAQGRYLYFVSDRPDGFGGRDIYRASYQNGEFGLASNLGIRINTEKDEYFPNPQIDGSLQFSSDGRMGYGGFDIYVASKTNRGFDEAQHLPYPFNSCGDDLQVISIYTGQQDISYGDLGEQHYIVSNREGGLGKDDIFLYERYYINRIQLHLTILEETEREKNQDIEDYVPSMNTLLEYSTNNRIIYHDSLAHDPFITNIQRNSPYTFKVSKEGFFTTRIEGSTEGVESPNSPFVFIYDTIRLERIITEKEIVIPNIYYAYDSASLLPESFPVLDTLVLLFQDNPSLVFELGSHTDSRGSDSYNLDLSQRRAQSVVDYFLSKGIPSENLKPKGYGETQLLNTCDDGVSCSEDDHQLNRRTSFKVVGSANIRGIED